jgi:hypothetical protein
MKILLFTLAFALSACSTLPSGKTGVANACFPEAMIMQKKLAAVQIPSRVISFEYIEAGVRKGHAAIVFCAGGETVAWDASGTRFLGSTALYGAPPMRQAAAFLDAGITTASPQVAREIR